MHQAPKQIPLQTVEKTMVKQAVTLQPMEDHGVEDTHAAVHREPMVQQGLGRTCGSTVGPMLEQPIPDGLCPLERIHAKAVLKSCFFQKCSHAASLSYNANRIMSTIYINLSAL